MVGETGGRKDYVFDAGGKNGYGCTFKTDDAYDMLDAVKRSCELFADKRKWNALVRHAMKLGLYEGVNLSLAYCDDCGYQQLEMDVCPKCGSTNLTKIDRMNGYLSYSRVKGDTRLNAAKMAEIADRKSM